jgi:hypothetical protein
MEGNKQIKTTPELNPGKKGERTVGKDQKYFYICKLCGRSWGQNSKILRNCLKCGSSNIVVIENKEAAQK